MQARDIPNIITIFRFLLVPPVVWMIVEQRIVTALLLFGIAGLSDAVDGYLAKRNNWTSRLGSILDPLADKLLLLSSFITLGLIGWIPNWLVMVVIARDLVIVLGALFYHFRIEQITGEPSRLSKLNTFTQILLVLVIMYSNGVQPLPAGVHDALVWTVLVTTVLSGSGYVLTWSRRALVHGRR